MTVESSGSPLLHSAGLRDVPLPEPADDAYANGAGAASFIGELGQAFGGASESLDRADGAERAFAAGRGGLQKMVLERAQADVALSLAGAVASRTSQALSTILGMQI